MALNSSSSGESKEEIQDTLLALVRAALDTYYADSDPSVYVAMYADSVTTFDPWSNGKMEDAAARDHLLGLAGTIPPLAYDIVDPRVDLYGDTAILTFNVDLTDPAGKAFAVWNTTQVHHRTGDGWQLVHTHWSFATPPPEEAGV